jgi:HAE1 family hydrophobic/amphiphilic exporter-1
LFHGQTETNVRLTSQFASPEELASIHINTNKGIAVPLSTLADVKEQDQRVSSYARTNGTDVVSMSVYKNSKANVVDTAKVCGHSLINCGKIILTTSS